LCCFGQRNFSTYCNHNVCCFKRVEK